MATIFGLILFLSTVLLLVSSAIEQADSRTSKIAVILTVAFGLSLIVYWYGEQKVGNVTQQIQDYQQKLDSCSAK
ncbi:MAG: hypothetical protein HC773_21245 [Scytonema sp. CRU_2_7]|nr:hypothetical protein [Scytonema sp. CRU_2_7]